MHSRSLVTIGLVGAVVSFACGTKGPAGTGTAGSTSTSSSGAGGKGGSSSTSSGMGGKAECKGPEPAHPGKKVTVGTIKVTVQDKDGKGLGDSVISVQLCHLGLCTYGMSTDGKYTLDGKNTMQDDPALKYGNQGKGDYLFWGGALPKTPDHDFGVINAVKLGPEGGKMVKGATVKSNEVSLTLEADADQASFVPEEGFRAVVFKPSDGKYPPLDATPQKFELVVGLGPAEVHMCPPAKLTFPNTLNWPANTQVDLWLNGVETFDHYVPYGSWAKVAEGVVSADGKTISTKDGKGVPATGAYGVVKK